MLREELKKIWLKQHIFLLLVLLLVVQGGYVGTRGLYSRYASKAAEKEESLYDEFLRSIGGKWDEKKDKQLNRWLAKRDECSKKYDSLVDQLLVQEISDETLQTYCKETPFVQNAYLAVLDDLSEKRDYIKEDSEHRYMIKGNGWIYFYEDHMIYYFYFLFLIVMIIPLFIREKETQMDILHALSTKGYGGVYRYKLIAIIMSIGIGLLLLYGEKYVLYQMRCSMEYGNCPIQSLGLFEDCPWQVSIWEGIIVELLLLFAGACFLLGIIVLCSMIVPRISEVCLATAMIVFIPNFVVSDEILFRYPFVSSLLFPDEYVCGFYATEGIDSGKYVYKSAKEFVIMIALVGVVTAAMLWCAKRRGEVV